MGLFKKKNHKLEPVTCPEENYLVWKWRPAKKKSKAEVMVGTKIVVAENATAVVVYQNEMGTYLDFITGPRDEVLSAENLPIISNIMGEGFRDGAVLPVVIYFINLSRTMQTGFSVPSFMVSDPSAPEIEVPVAVKGLMSYRVADAAEFVKRHRLDEVTEEALTEQVITATAKYVRAAVVSAPSVDHLPVVEFERRTDEINSLVEIPVRERLAEELGVKVTSVDIEMIDIDEESEGYKRLAGIASANTNVAEEMYYVAVKGKPVGPYRADTIKKLVAAGTITANSLVWHRGMNGWTKIADVAELK